MGFKTTITHIFEQMRNRRNLAIAFITLILVSIWSVYGAEIISTLNPALGHELAVASHPALDVWITPPDYTKTSPMIISTPAGIRFERDTLVIPQGSTLSAHLAEQDGDVPELVIDGDSQEFVTDAHGDYEATETLNTGKKLTIRRGWLTLASWKVRIVTDNPPKVALTEPPSITEGKALRIAYSASDDLGITDVAVRVTPSDPMPGASNAPVDVMLPIPEAKQLSRVDFKDLTSYPWAGQKVSLQIVATNLSGKQSVSDAVPFVLPQRQFFHPVARLLVEERRKLLLHPDDQRLREETANIMAGIAHETSDYHGDPVILMALRSGAVRLVLSNDHEAALSVNDLLWQAAARIEDGSSGSAQRMLRDARQDLALAIDRNASQEEIQLLTIRLQQAMGTYLSRISDHKTASSSLPAAKPTKAASPTAEDMKKIIQYIKDLSEAGATDQARTDLFKLEAVLEGFDAH